MDGTAAHPTSEDDRTAPFSPYGIIERAAEQLCRPYPANLRLPAVVLRYSPFTDPFSDHLWRNPGQHHHGLHEPEATGWVVGLLGIAPSVDAGRGWTRSRPSRQLADAPGRRRAEASQRRGGEAVGRPGSGDVECTDSDIRRGRRRAGLDAVRCSSPKVCAGSWTGEGHHSGDDPPRFRGNQRGGPPRHHQRPPGSRGARPAARCRRRRPDAIPSDGRRRAQRRVR
jgi:hypothetical protein